MKKIRRVMFLLALISVVASIVLLLNITAPNPTGRRYSSAMPHTAQQIGSQMSGTEAEQILAKDLRLPNNNADDQLQCLCNPNFSLNNSKCGSCKTKSSSCIANFRIPDFIAPEFIADSKNYTSPLSLSDQLSDFICWSRENRLRLWIFVRKNTPVDSDLISEVESTGGGIVYYFTVPGYADPVDGAAQKGLLVSGAMVAGVGWLEWRYLRRRVRVIVVDLPTGKPSPKRPVNKISRKLDHAEDFAEKSKDWLDGQLHDEDVWGDEA